MTTKTKPPTKAQLLKARQEELGKCRTMKQSKKTEPEPCTNWAVDEKGYCGQHYTSIVNRELQTQREAMYKADLDRRITEHLEWKKEHPSVWDQ